MNEDPTPREILIRLDNLSEKMEAGFRGVNDRLDYTNGKVMRNTEFRSKAEVKFGFIQWFSGALFLLLLGTMAKVLWGV